MHPEDADQPSRGPSRPGAAPAPVEGRARTLVGPSDTAAAWRSGDLEVLGTPRVLALAEEATVEALRGQLDAGETSVGVRVALEHVAPVGLGAEVEAVARETGRDGRRVVFAVEVRAGGLLVARGEVVRAVVDRKRFLSRLEGPGGRA